MKRLTVLSFFLTSLLLTTACGEESAKREHTPPPGRTLDFTAEVIFLDDSGEEITTIEAAVADTDETRTEGLMDVRSLEPYQGMIFIFDDEARRSFWMANTPLSLDIIFLNNDLEIVRIHQNTRPYSQRSIESERPARYVVEVNAGFSRRHDLREGMSIRTNPEF